MGPQGPAGTLHRPLIFDTDIAIWMLRGEPSALTFASAAPADRRLISVISQLELLQGCRNLRERRALEELLQGWFTEIVPLDASISHVAVRLMRHFGLSHRPEAADVLIAATALQTGEPLATANVRHFRFVPGLRLETFSPHHGWQNRRS